MGQQREEEGAQHTSLGVPVFSMMVLDVLPPTRTVWGLPVRKSSIQLQREVLSPSWISFLMSCCGMMVLNVELKSINSILTYDFLFSRWVSTEWRAVAMASSVER